MAPEVDYQGGAPQFEPIEKTTVPRAVNTDKDILKVGDLYYMCFQGVWFMSKAPTGPWQVTGEVPKTIYEIPVSSPSHAVTYVTVEDSNDDAVVFATAAAFTGVMVAWGCAVWGTGYYYPPYIGYGGMYPYYRPYYPTYGYGASYNPWTGAYTRGAVAYGPYGGAGVGAALQPENRHLLARRRGLRPVRRARRCQAYNPRTGAYGATRQGSNVYGSWGTTGVARGDRVGDHLALHQQRDGQHDARDPGQRRRRAVTRTPALAAERCGAQRRRRRVRRPRRQRLQEGRRQLAEVRQWRLEQRGPADAAAAAGAGPRDARRRTDARSCGNVRLGLVDARPGHSRFRRARRGCAADPRLRQRAAAARRRGQAAIVRAAEAAAAAGRRR